MGKAQLQCWQYILYLFVDINKHYILTQNTENNNEVCYTLSIFIFIYKNVHGAISVIIKLQVVVWISIL